MFKKTIENHENLRFLLYWLSLHFCNISEKVIDSFLMKYEKKVRRSAHQHFANKKNRKKALKLKF